MNEDFSNRLLERIEEERIKPLPRWVVFARRAIAWTTLVLAVLCAGLLGSLLLLAVLQVDIQFLRRSSLGPMLRLVLDYVPLVWILLFLALCALEVFLLRHETRAYRYSGAALAGLVLIGVSLIGLGFYAAKLPERIEHSLQRGLPPRVHPWAMRRPPPRPEHGILFGEVTSVSSTTLYLRGPRGESWQVNLSEQAAQKLDLLQPGQLILIEGRIINRGIFEGREVRPFRGPKRSSFRVDRRALQTF